MQQRGLLVVSYVGSRTSGNILRRKRRCTSSHRSVLVLYGVLCYVLCDVISLCVGLRSQSRTKKAEANLRR